MNLCLDKLATNYSYHTRMFFPGTINKYLQAKNTISGSLAFTCRAVSCNMSETKQFVETLNNLVSAENLYRTSSFQLCLLCHMAANAAIILRKLGVSKEIFANLATFICVSLNGYSATFCNDIVKLNIVSIIQAKSLIILFNFHFHCSGCINIYYG